MARPTDMLTDAELADLRDRATMLGLPLFSWDWLDHRFDEGLTVNFDGLPDSDPYRDEPTQTVERLYRTLTILQALTHTHASEDLLVMRRAWLVNGVPNLPEEEWYRHFVGGREWVTGSNPRELADATPGDDVVEERLFLSRVDVADPSIAALVLLVLTRDDQWPLIFDRSMTWILQPCDLGAHVLVESAQHADALSDIFPEWTFRPHDRHIPTFAGEQLQWQLRFSDLPQQNVRRIRQLAEENDLLPTGSRAHLTDPRRELLLHIDRNQAKLLRILASGVAEAATVGMDTEPRVRSFDEARALLWPSGENCSYGESIDGQLNEFIDEDSYLEPTDVSGQAIPPERRDPSRNYDGVSEPADEA